VSVVGDGPVGQLLRRALASLPVRCFRRFGAIGGRNRALVLAGQAFIAFIPLLILVSVVTASSAGGVLPEQMVTRFHLSGDAADAMRTLFARPPDSEGALTVISAVVLFASLLSFARALQGTYEVAWALASRGVRGILTGLAGITLLLSQILLLSLLVSLLSGGLGARVGSTVLRAVVGIPFWLALQFVLLSGRVPWRVLLPGAVVMGIGQSLISLGSAVWMPHLVSTNAARYGTIGVTFALLSWLILVCAAIVAGAAVSVEMSGYQQCPCGPPT
jgi:membrane protein